ncbi:hypothetical protein AB0P37_39445 [Streptomyces antimycoticus]|uniref:hypothetical protein n=1 Tax=Streptomyces antimycoticus TaxID=68175 RepID=UPI0034226AB0
MHRARVESTGRHVFRHHIGPPRQFSGELICWKCTAPVVAVRAHTNKGAPVQAQYRLKGKTEHDADCPLNPTLVSHHIAHGSHGLAEVDEKGILRLNLPENISHVPTTVPDEDVIAQDVVRHSVTTVRPLLPPAVNSAVKITQLLMAHDFERDLVKRFKVRPHGGGLIPWGRFCYGPTAESYAELFQRCRRGEVFTYPIAVLGTVQRVNHDRHGRPYIALALNVPAAGGAFHVAVRSEHPTLIEPLTPGTHVLAVSAGWEVFNGGHLPQLRMWAGEHWQLAYWTTDEDQTTPPRCPPPVTAAQRGHAQAEARRRRTARQSAPPATPPDAPRPPAPIPSDQPPAETNAAEPTSPEPHPSTELRPPAQDAPAAGMNEPATTDAPAAVPDADPAPAGQPAAGVPPRPEQPPAVPPDAAPEQPWQGPPLPPFPPPGPGEDGRRGALRRWLKRARRRA